MSTEDATWRLNINFGKILRDTLKSKKSYQNYILVVPIQPVIQMFDICYLPQSDFSQINGSNPVSGWIILKVKDS